MCNDVPGAGALSECLVLLLAVVNVSHGCESKKLVQMEEQTALQTTVVVPKTPQTTRHEKTKPEQKQERKAKHKKTPQRRIGHERECLTMR